MKKFWELPLHQTFVYRSGHWSFFCRKLGGNRASVSVDYYHPDNLGYPPANKLVMFEPNQLVQPTSEEDHLFQPNYNKVEEHGAD